MTMTTLQDEIRELNLTFLMLSQRMLRDDREAALFRLGIGADVADMLLALSSAQLVRMASNPMVLPRFRFDDTLMTGLLAGQGRDQAAAGLHAAILATGRPVANQA